MPERKACPAMVPIGCSPRDGKSHSAPLPDPRTRFSEHAATSLVVGIVQHLPVTTQPEIYRREIKGGRLAVRIWNADGRSHKPLTSLSNPGSRCAWGSSTCRSGGRECNVRSHADYRRRTCSFGSNLSSATPVRSASMAGWDKETRLAP